MRIWVLVLGGMMVAMSAAAQDTASPDAHVRLYQSDQALVIKSQGDAGASAKTDPLSTVNEVALKLSFVCAETGCAGASAHMTVESIGGDTAAITLTPAANGLRADVDGQPVALVLKQGEAFDLRIHWNAGHRVTFDLYHNDPTTGASSMESHDAKLTSNVRDLAMSTSHGALTLLSQTYTFGR